VLIEQGRLDEAEAELETSLAQEPSAKAEFLLRRIRQLRGEHTATVAARPLVIDPAAMRPATSGSASPDLAAVDSRIVIDALDATTRNDAAVAIMHGRFTAPTGTPLWLVSPDGEATPIPLASDGTFASAAPIGGSLASGGG